MTIRPELDPKLTRKLGLRLTYVEFLARTQPAELAKLHAAESKELQELEGRILEGRKQLQRASSPDEQERRRKRLRDLHDRLFAPVTAGVHLPDSSGRAPTWPEGPRKPFVSAFVVLENVKDQVAMAELARLEVTVRTRARKVLTALIPIASLRAVAASKVVRSVELARPLFQNEDYSTGDAVESAGILARHLANEKGDGVIVGVVDDELDLAHPDFQFVDEAGQTRSRVLYLWQQDLEAPQGTATAPPALPAYAESPGASYGTQYTQADIDGRIAGTGTALFPKQPPKLTHGTLVTGCAAGSGRAFQAFLASHDRPADLTGHDLVGAAPNADIVFVSRQGICGMTLEADATAVCDAFAYVFERAKDETKPCVVNLSHSDNLGPHDGTGFVESFLEGLLLDESVGRTVTLSAGNSNRTSHHASDTLKGGRSYALHLRYSEGPPTTLGRTLPTHSDTVEIWYPATQRVTLTLSIPATDTTPATVVGPVAATGDDAKIVGDVTVMILSRVPGPGSDNVISVMLTLASGGSIPLGDWIFTLQAESADDVVFHAWVDRSNRGLSAWLAPALVNDSVTLANPSAAGEAITVGAHDMTSPTPDIEKYSGCGLTRTGGAKPDLAAPGIVMLAPCPVHLASDPAFPYAKGGGTSVAAPLVAGSCAILFQTLGSLRTHAQIKASLLAQVGTLTAAQPEKFGAGFLRM